MAGVYAQSQTFGKIGCFYIRGNRFFSVCFEFFGIGSCIKFYSVCTYFGSTLYHLKTGIHKNGGTYPKRLKFGNNIGQKLFVLNRIPAGIGSDGIVCIGTPST